MFNRKKAVAYCKDDISLIENYQEAKESPELWVCHHRLEVTLNGELALSFEELVRLNMYYKRPYYELIFMKKSDHQALHNSLRIWKKSSKMKISNANKGRPSKIKGRIKSMEERKRLSEGHKGQVPWNKGKKGSQIPWNKGVHLSEETKRKISETKRIGKK